jgi:nitrite reductase/ring-hydroxylating ferredoxin subunit
MAWVQIISLSDLADKRHVAEVNGEKLLVFRDQEQVHAVALACPHLKMPLTKATICKGAIVCPWHKSAFDLATGAVKAWSPWPPLLGKLLGYLVGKKPLKIYPTKVEDGEVHVLVEDSPS